MGWLDPRIWLAVLGSCALCLLGGYMWGRHEMRGVELAKCQTEKADAALAAATDLDNLQQANLKAATQRAAERLADDRLMGSHSDAIRAAAKSIPACPALPADLVRRLDAAGQGDFVSGIGESGGVPATGVPAPKR